MTEITLKLTFEELKQIDKYIEYHDYDCDKPLLEKIKNAYPKPETLLDVIRNLGYSYDMCYEIVDAVEKFEKSKEPEKEQQIKELVRESVKWCEEHPDESVEDYLTPQERGDQIHKEVENEIEKLQEKNWYVAEENDWKTVALLFGKKLPVIPPYGYDELSPNAWYTWVVFNYDYYIKQRDIESGRYPTPPQTPEQIEKSLRTAFGKAQQTEKWKEIQKLIDEEDNDKNFKNSLDLIREWGEKNKPPTLKELLWEWWEDIFTSNSDLDADASIDILVDMIDKKFIPPSSDRNGYEWEKCLKMMRDKLR